MPLPCRSLSNNTKEKVIHGRLRQYVCPNGNVWNDLWTVVWCFIGTHREDAPRGKKIVIIICVRIFVKFPSVLELISTYEHF